MESRCYKIDSSKDNITNVMLIFLKNSETGEFVTKTYKTDPNRNTQSFVMMPGKNINFIKYMNKRIDQGAAVEITKDQFNELSAKLKDSLC
mgnify:CR=1 FL=1